MAVAVSWALLAQGWGGNQDSHYALIRALAAGSTTIDRTRHEVGTVQPPTPDISLYHGRAYSNKAPGFAFFGVPAYLVMKGAGDARPVADTTKQLWFLGVWGCVLPGLLLLLLVRRIADDVEPGMGTLTAVTLGLGTMVFPFSTLFFSHVFSALLGFAAFALLWFERRRPERLWTVAAAGFLAGYAITTEFPNAIAAGLVGCYALARPGWLRRGVAYAAGALLGLAPLLAYNAAAFGSAFHLSYQSTVGFGPTGSLFLVAPSFRRAVEVLFAPVGLLTLTPVMAVGMAGTVLLYRRGYRAEALLIAAVALAYLLFEASYIAPFGGASPGPRQLIPILAFLAVPLAAMYRRFPVATLALAGASAVEIIVLTITRPLSSSFYLDWFQRFGASDFSQTVFGLVGLPRDDGIYLLLAAGALAAVLALVVSGRPELSWRDALTGAALLAGWLLIERRAPKLLNGSELGRGNGAFTTALLSAAIVLAAVLRPRIVTAPASGPPERQPGARSGG